MQYRFPGSLLFCLVRASEDPGLRTRDVDLVEFADLGERLVFSPGSPSMLNEPF
jgi:hypothetical protein